MTGHEQHTLKMENATYLLVSGGGGEQLSAVTVTSVGSTEGTLSNGNQIAVAGIDGHSYANVISGKSVLNLRTVGPQLVGNWKSGDIVGRQGNSQIRLVIANQKDSPVMSSNIPVAGVTNLGFAQNFAGSFSNAGGIKVQMANNSATAGAQKMTPAAVLNISTPVRNTLRQPTIAVASAGSGKLSVRHAVAPVDKKSLSTGQWSSLPTIESVPAGAVVTTSSPSKVVIQLNAEQLSLLTNSVPQAGVRVPGTAGHSISTSFLTNSGPQYVRVVASQQPIQPKLLPATVAQKPGGTNVGMTKTKSSSSVSVPHGNLVVTQPSTTQRLILPATPQMRQSTATPAFFQTMAVGGGMTNSSLSASAVAQPPGQFVDQTTFYQQNPKMLSVSCRSRSLEGASTSDDTLSQHRLQNWTPDPPVSRPRKPCNCTKSQCLKLYCECFANGEFCNDCNCCNCYNNLIHEDERTRAVKACLERNPHAFHPKIGKGGNIRQHCKGCNCKRSGCLKNYCECYEAKIPCSSLCRCIGCKNFEENPDQQSLLHLADAAEVRVQQQAAAETKLASQIVGPPARPQPVAAGAERPAYTFVTLDVIEAISECLIAETEEFQQSGRSDVLQEQRIITEFGRCLEQLIGSASKTRAPTPFDH